MLRRDCWALSALMLARPTSLGAAVRVPQLINFDAGSAPTQYAGRNDAAAGIYPAIVRAAFALIDEPVRLQPRPFKRVLSEFRAGTAAGGALVRTAERQAVGDYSADYFDERVAVFHRARESFAYASVADLRGQRIGVIRGWSYGEEFDAARAERQFLVEEVESDAQNFGKLSRGRIELALVTEMAGRMLKAGPAFAEISAAPLPLISIGIGLAFNKKHGQQGLLRRFDEAVASLRRAKLIESLVNQEITLAQQWLQAAEARLRP